MKQLMDKAPKVADAFFSMTAAIRESSALDTKTNELILLGILTANRALRGIVTHATRALEAGATEEELISSVYLALPICGIANVNMALSEVLTTIQRYQDATAHAD